jgi:hypothetical protein
VCAWGTRLHADPPVLKAQQLIDRITTKLNGYWPATGNDGLKDGDPATPVTGVAVTMMSTMDVLQRSAAAGANFVITHEPTFYSGNDSLAKLEQENDAVTATKRAFIRENHMDPRSLALSASCAGPGHHRRLPRPRLVAVPA